MKVCQLCAVDFTLKHFLLPLIDAHLENGDEVIAVCSDGEYIQSIRQAGYYVYTIPIYRSLNPLKHLFSIWELYRYFLRESFDVVHVHTPIASLLGRIAAYLARVNFVIYTAHGFYFHDDMPILHRRIHIILEKITGRMTDLLFTQSDEDAKIAVSENIMPRDRVFPIGNGVDIRSFDPNMKSNGAALRSYLDIPEGAFVVGMIGRQVEEKGIVEFLQAARILTGHYSYIRFLLIGGRLVSDHATAVDDMIDKCKVELGKHLILTGMRSDIPELLSIMDLFVLPSWREGMPRTIIEAMVMGLPVVATDIRGSREEVVHEGTGLLVPVRNAEELLKAISRCVENPAWSERLGKAGRKRALELYDEKRVVDLQMKLVNRFVNVGK